MKRIIFVFSILGIAMTKMGNCQAPILSQPYQDAVSQPVSSSLGTGASVNGNNELGYGAYDPSIKPLYVTPSIWSSLPGLLPGGIGPVPAFKTKPPALPGVSPAQASNVPSLSSSSSWAGSAVASPEQAAFIAGSLEQVRQIPSNSGPSSVSSWVAGTSAFIGMAPGQSQNAYANNAAEDSSLAQLLSIHQGYLLKGTSLSGETSFSNNTILYNRTVPLGRATSQLQQQLLQNELGHIPGVSEKQLILAPGQPDLTGMTQSSSLGLQEPSSEAKQIPREELSTDQDTNGPFNIDITLSDPGLIRAFQPNIARSPTQAGMKIRLVETKDGLQLVLEQINSLTGSILADESGVSAPTQGWWAWSAGSGSWIPTEEKNTVIFQDPSDIITRRLLKATQPSEMKPAVLKQLSPDDVE